jgi:uncharacterized protein (TIGR00251 family)
MSAWHRWDGADLVLRLRVVPRSPRDALLLDGPQLKARIAAPPVDGAANDRLLRYLAAEFGVARSRVSLLRGSTGRDKVVRIGAPTRLPLPLAGPLRRVGDS